MSYQIVVCVKQVPDTENITADAMKEDGTVNRSALPAIFNPADLNALEMALQVREEYGGSITIITMGPPSAAEVLRQALYRRADRAILLTDIRFAASDTLATSYVLSCGIKKLPEPDLVFCGRQAIDGDTAQIGPQLAEKLGILQFTYVDEIREISNGQIVVKRNLEGGYEVVRGPLPCLLTVFEGANEPRPPAARKLMEYKKARAASELPKKEAEQQSRLLKQQGLLIEQWNAQDIDCDRQRCGGSGSPTKVKSIESVVLTSKEHKRVEPTAEGLDELMGELTANHLFD